MADDGSLPLRLVDAVRLEQDVRDALLPGATRVDGHGVVHRLPRLFYEVRSWDEALDVELAEHFRLWEFIQTDAREALPLQRFPRYIPCALPLLAAALECFRTAVGTYVHIAANGGYRSPRHLLARERASTHCWGTAVNIYRIGDTVLDNRDAISRYAAIARKAMPGVWVRPCGTAPGEVDDHLHLDLGYVVAEPRHEALGPATALEAPAT
jgi:hypothetical protein